MKFYYDYVSGRDRKGEFQTTDDHIIEINTLEELLALVDKNELPVIIQDHSWDESINGEMLRYLQIQDEMY